MSSSELMRPDPTKGSTAHVELGSRIPSLELTLVAWDFRPVASGLGRLSADVAPGVYQVVTRAGPVVERRLISLAAGEAHTENDLTVAFPSAAPVRGTTTSHEYHEQLAGAASRQPQGKVPGADSGLVVMVRDVRGQNGPPLDPSELRAFQLLDSSLSRVEAFDAGWIGTATDGAAAWSGQLASGGYALRTVAGAAAPTAPRRPPVTTVDQSVWLAPGWQTLVFITTGAGGPSPASASVHMSRLGVGWDPSEREVDQALELAQWGLREGRAVVPDDLLGLLLGSKFQDPMLGIVGAHGLLLRPSVDPILLRTVLQNLDGLVPGHPDVAGLRRMAQERGVDAPPVTPGAATWPPMLVASYRGLINADARDPGVIVDGSVAERAAARLSLEGIWTSWQPLDAVPPVAAGEFHEALGVSASASSTPSAIAVLPMLGAAPAAIRSLRLSDPAAMRVRGYLAAVADLEDPATLPERFATMSPQEIGLATSLPAGSVDRALAAIRRALPPVAPPPGGPPRPEQGDKPARPDDTTPDTGPEPGLPARLGGRAPLFIGGAGVLVLALAGVVALASGGPRATPTPSSTPYLTPPPSLAPAPTATLPPTSVPTPTLAPPPLLDFPPTMDFKAPFGESMSLPLTLTNVGGSPLTVRVIRLADQRLQAFALNVGDCRPNTLQPAAQCTATVTFEPPDVGEWTGSLTITTAQLPAAEVTLQGVGTFVETVPPVATPPPVTLVVPETYTFEYPNFEQIPIHVGGAGPANAVPVSITRIEAIAFNDGSPAGHETEFTLDGGKCAGVPIDASTGCDLLASFKPPSAFVTDTMDYLISTSDGTAYRLRLIGTGLIGVRGLGT